MICVFFLLWLTSYYVILAYCVLCTVLWVVGVDVYNVDSPLFVCACFMGTPVCVCYILDARMTTGSYIRAVICRCVACYCVSTMYINIF